MSAGNCADPLYAVNRLKAGPENLPKVIKDKKAARTKYSDPWTGKDVLFKPGYPSSSDETNWGNNFDTGAWTYERFYEATGYTDATLFKDNTDTCTEPRQGGAGTCYWISALATAAEWPSMITDMFVTGTDMSWPDSCIIGIKLFIRGKPWVVSIDDKLFFYQSGSNKYLKFNQPDATGKIFWAAILEKAWAKVKGNYEMSEGGFTVTGLRAITGVPVFRYATADISD